MKGLRYRTVGLSIDIFKDMGVSVNDLPSGDIIPAMDRNLLDGQSLIMPLQTVYWDWQMFLKSVCCSPFINAQNNLKFCLIKRNCLMPEELRAMIGVAVQASSAEMSWKAIDRYSKDYMDLQSRQNVKFYKTPDLILRAQLMAWTKSLLLNL